MAVSREYRSVYRGLSSAGMKSKEFRVSSEMAQKIFAWDSSRNIFRFPSVSDAWRRFCDTTLATMACRPVRHYKSYYAGIFDDNEVLLLPFSLDIVNRPKDC